MPTSIPFNPSLVLGNLIKLEDIDKLKAVAQAEVPVNNAQQNLNDSITTKRKLDMTLQELVEMNVSPKELEDFTKTIKELEDSIVKNASTYGEAVITCQGNLAKAKANLSNITITEMPESPIDWNKSAIKTMPLSSNTMVADVQFVHNQFEKDVDSAYVNAIGATVQGSMSSIFGPHFSSKAATSAKSVALQQSMANQLVGTIVITVACTHEKSDIMAPFILDPEKAVYAWNALFPDQIDTTNPASLTAAIKNASAAGKKSDKEGLNLLSGRTLGSSFVGMVHILKTENTNTTQKVNSLTSKMTSAFSYGAFLASGEGKFGVDKSFSDSVKNMLSTSALSTHCSIVTMGIIPSIKCNDITTTVRALDPDPASVMKGLSKIQEATSGDVESMTSQADKAKTGKEYMTLQNGYIDSAVTSIGKLQGQQNSVIDTNSLMTAFDHYVNNASDGNTGIPINFFVRHIDKPMIAKAWLNKFSPKKYWQYSSGDDASKGEASPNNQS